MLAGDFLDSLSMLKIQIQVTEISITPANTWMKHLATITVLGVHADQYSAETTFGEKLGPCSRLMLRNNIAMCKTRTSNSFPLPTQACICYGNQDLKWFQFQCCYIRDNIRDNTNFQLYYENLLKLVIKVVLGCHLEKIQNYYIFRKWYPQIDVLLIR